MLIAALASFVLGVCVLQAQSQLAPMAVLAIAALGGCALLVAGARSKDTRLAAVLIVCGALAAGFGYAGVRAHWRMAEALAPDDEGRDVRITGVVASLPARLDRGVRFEFDVEAQDPQASVPARILLGWYNAGEPVRAGERWRFLVRLKRPHGTVNPGGYDFEAWMIEQNLRASGSVRSTAEPPERLQGFVVSPRYAIERARGDLRDRMLGALGGLRYGGVLLALVLGDQRAIGEADWSLFNGTGIAHLVSISGLHITMIAALIGGIVAFAWRRVRWLLQRVPAQSAGIVAGVGAAVAYALLAGWGIPAQRTVLMLACVAAVWLLRRRLTAGAALAVAAAVVCVFDPWAVTAAGFWLSFGAVAAIVWAVLGRPSGDRSAISRLALAARVQVAVTLMLVPATVMFFQQVSLVSPLANAIAIPVVSWVVTPLALVGAVAALLPLPLAAIAVPLLAAADGVFAALAWLLGALSASGWATAAVPAPPLAFAALAIAGVAWLLAPPGWPARGLGAVVAMPLLFWPGERPAPGTLWVTALDVGQGSAVVIETHGEVWLYDAGPRYSQDADAGARVVLPYLRSRGIGTVDGLVVSHLDQDHSGGAASIVRGIPVARLLTSISPDHPILAGYPNVERCSSGMTAGGGEPLVRMLHPAAADYGRRMSTNAMSCVALFIVGPNRVLLTGDLPADEEARLVARELSPSAPLLMAPHHGSRSSSSEALLDAVGAKAAFAQAGYHNRFHHPDATIVARYAARAIEFSRTDRDGALQWRFAADGSVDRRRWRAVAVRYWHDRPVEGQSGPADDDGDASSEEPGREPVFGIP